MCLRAQRLERTRQNREEAKEKREKIEKVWKEIDDNKWALWEKEMLRYVGKGSRPYIEERMGGDGIWYEDVEEVRGVRRLGQWAFTGAGCS
jgi:hypothetical protein